MENRKIKVKVLETIPPIFIFLSMRKSYEIQNLEYLGIKIKFWIKIFKVLAEGRNDEQIDAGLDRILRDVKQNVADSD